MDSSLDREARLAWSRDKLATGSRRKIAAMIRGNLRQECPAAAVTGDQTLDRSLAEIFASGLTKLEKPKLSYTWLGRTFSFDPPKRMIAEVKLHGNLVVLTTKNIRDGRNEKHGEVFNLKTKRGRYIPVG